MSRPNILVCEWSASLYLEAKRKWIYGNLAIHSSSVFFTTDTNPEKNNVNIPFEEFSDVKKATTGLVFGAVYIVKTNGKKIWLSSLADREGVFGALKHFWRTQLIPESKPRPVMPGARTERGTKILGILKDSESTLTKAASQLQSQGAQIDNSLGIMSDLHNDLDVADNLVDGIDSWFGFWRMPKQDTNVDPVNVSLSDIPEVFEYEVIYLKLEYGKSNMRHVGLLRISKEGMTILTEKQKVVHHYRWSDVSQIRVVTPYEIVLTRFQIGQSDLSYTVVSASMVAVLRLLDKCAKYKLKYDTPPETVLCTRHAPARQTVDQRPVPATSQQPRNRDITANMAPLQVGAQLSQSEQIVSEAEANEISRTLAGLKSLAIGVEQEGTSQNEKLDVLRDTVDDANERLVDANKRIKRMT